MKRTHQMLEDTGWKLVKELRRTGSYPVNLWFKAGYGTLNQEKAAKIQLAIIRGAGSQETGNES